FAFGQDGQAAEPEEVFAAAAGLQPNREVVVAAVRIVKLSTSAKTDGLLLPSAVRSLDFRGQRLAARSGGPANRFAGRSARSPGRTSPPVAAPPRPLECVSPGAIPARGATGRHSTRQRRCRVTGRDTPRTPDGGRTGRGRSR